MSRVVAAAVENLFCAGAGKGLGGGLLEYLATNRVRVHCAGVARIGDSLHTIRINRYSPACVHDRFLLALMRSLASSVLLGAATVRSEPNLSRHRFGKHEVFGPALGEVRSTLLGEEVELCGVFSRGASGSVPWRHRYLRPHGDGEVCVLTGAEEAEKVEKEGLSVVGAEFCPKILPCPPPSNLLSALHRLRQEKPSGMQLIEAGPTLTAPMYKEQGVGVVDFLALGVFHGELDTRAIGKEFFDESDGVRGVERLQSSFLPWQSHPSTPSLPTSPQPQPHTPHPPFFQDESLLPSSHAPLFPNASSAISTARGMWEFGLFMPKKDE